MWVWLSQRSGGWEFVRGLDVGGERLSRSDYVHDLGSCSRALLAPR
jgi:hypothetical protein